MYTFSVQGLASTLQHPAVGHSILAAKYCHVNKSNLLRLGMVSEEM